MVQIEIYEEFEKWLNDLLENNTIPDDAKAFNFNLYEESEEDSIYGVQLIAADRFDENDPDWACDEVWSSEEDIFCVDTSDEEDSGWKNAMDLIGGLVSEYLENGLHRNLLRGTDAVGIGFVDGDIELLYKAEK
ncbi:MAG: hypothetical protein IJM55_04615 [Ruminococcus sp.]|nr:hypothetical protein [Ruminococcus sp.]